MGKITDKRVNITSSLCVLTLAGSWGILFVGEGIKNIVMTIFYLCVLILASVFCYLLRTSVFCKSLPFLCLSVLLSLGQLRCDRTTAQEDIGV